MYKMVKNKKSILNDENFKNALKYCDAAKYYPINDDTIEPMDVFKNYILAHGIRPSDIAWIIGSEKMARDVMDCKGKSTLSYIKTLQRFLNIDDEELKKECGCK